VDSVRELVIGLVKSMHYVIETTINDVIQHIASIPFKLDFLIYI
jgi:hypothetical protein